MDKNIKNSNNDSVYILYGSQTGQAEAIANEIYESALLKNLYVKLHCLKDEGKLFSIQNVNFAIFVCSTTGDGDPPENARKFIRVISRKTLTPDFLSHLSYALLGLGDSNYSTFCGGPKRLEKALKAHGAVSFYPTAYADDGVDLEGTVEPWIDGLFPAVKSHLGWNLKKSINDGEILADQPQNCVASDDKKNNALVDEIEANLSQLKVADKIPKLFSVTVESDAKASDVLKNNCFPISNELIIDKNTVASSPLLQTSDLSNMNLILPPLIPTYLKLVFNENAYFDPKSVVYQNGASFPIASSEMHRAKVVSAKQISRNDAVKRAIEIKLSLQTHLDFNPGDSFAICCINDEKEVNWLIKRLSLESVADFPAILSICDGTTKKHSVIPPHIPQPFTIRHVLGTCLEIRSVPRKPFLRALSEFTLDEKEKRRIQEFCSKQGASEYHSLIIGGGVTFMDILASFPSCMPPFELLIQHLPRLKLRRYSIANSPLIESNSLTFAFNVLRFPAENGRLFNRNGVCTGFLEKIVEIHKNNHLESADSTKIDIFLTKSTGFHLPTNPKQPIVMIGPGTGVAPFVGFLQHRSALNEPLGESWLFYGCRHKDRDFLYENDLKHFEKCGVLTNLLVAFSRDSTDSEPRYVQDNLRLHKSEIVNLILNKNAVFYICGDAKNMSKDIRNCIKGLIALETGYDDSKAAEMFSLAVSEGRYKEDVWS